MDMQTDEQRDGMRGRFDEKLGGSKTYLYFTKKPVEVLEFINAEISRAVSEDRERLTFGVAVMCEPTPSANAHQEYNRGIREGVQLIRNAVISLIQQDHGNDEGKTV